MASVIVGIRIDGRCVVLRRPIELAIVRPPDAAVEVLVQPDELEKFAHGCPLDE